MKKASLLLAVLIVLSVLSGCAGKPDTAPSNNANTVPAENTENTSPADNSANTVPADNSANTVPADNTANTVPEDGLSEEDVRWLTIYDSGALSESAMADFLEGKWDMIPNGDPKKSGTFGFLEFDKASGMLSFTYNELDAKGFASCSCKPSHLIEGYGDPSVSDLLALKVESASDSVRNRAPALIDSTADLEIRTARVLGNDIITLREIGNGESAFGMEVLLYDNQTQDGIWVFVRSSGSLSKFEKADKTEEDLIVKSGSFYAVRWMDYSDRYVLQRVDTRDFEEKFYEEPIQVKSVMYTDTGNALYAASYNVKSASASEKNGIYAPQLVYVTTDENGMITDCDLIPYFGFGLYSQEHIKEDEDTENTRDPEIYGRADSVFTGHWTKTEDPQSWVQIDIESAQSSGYRVVFYEKDVFSAAGYADISGSGAIELSQCYIDGALELSGFFEETESGIRFTVTASASEKIPQGTVIEYKKIN